MTTPSGYYKGMGQYAFRNIVMRNSRRRERLQAHIEKEKYALLLKASKDDKTLTVEEREKIKAWLSKTP